MADTWNPLQAMPTGRDFEAYHLREPSWRHVIFHSHPYYEIYIFLHGNIRITVQDQEYTDVQPYDLFIFPPGYMHQNITNDESGYYERAYFYITESCLRSLSSPACDLAEMLTSAVQNRYFHFHLGEERCRPLLSQIDEVTCLADSVTPTQQLIARSRMGILMATLCETLSSLAPDTAAVVNSRPAQVMRYIDRHSDEEITLDTLSERFYISKYHLSREFKEYAGSTVHQYLLMKRIVRAQLLIQSGSTPMEASEACGFHDYTGFYRAFRSRTGHPPQEYAQAISGRGSKGEMIR